jgi:hypothetical protein
MTSEDPDRVRRVRVTDPVAAARDHDYADAFELRLEGPHPCSAEAWVRAGVDAVPAWIKRIAGSPDGLGSARVVASGPDVVVLEDSDPLMDTVMVGRNLEPDRRVLTTVLRYRRPRLARAVWAVVGILHRRTARRVVAGGLPRSSLQVADRLRPLVAVAIAVSVVHYADNVFNYDAYPQPASGPAPSQATVAVAWFGFTALAAAAWGLLRRSRVTAAALCLALYAGSGLVGLGHYAVEGATEMPWWRQAHIVADIACGVAVLASASWLARRSRGRALAGGDGRRAPAPSPPTMRESSPQP